MTLLSGDISKNVITNQLEMKIITETEASLYNLLISISKEPRWLLNII